MTSESAVANLAQAGKYLSFMLGKVEFGLEILKVQEIIGMMGVTRIPGAPAFVRGITNLHGRDLPVISLRRKFGQPTVADTEKTCLIVVEVSNRDESLTLGLQVDEVSEVVSVGAAQIREAAPEVGKAYPAGAIQGIGQWQDRTVHLLDIDHIITPGDLEDLGGLMESCTSNQGANQ